MPFKLTVIGDAQALKLDFNKTAGIKALDIKNKFIGIDTREKNFQALFKDYPKVQKIFREGYSEEFSKEFSVGRASVEASGELILAKIYAKLGLMIESAGYDLGGVTIKSKQTGSFDLLASTPAYGNGFNLSTKTISSLSGVPTLSAKLPDAYLKAKLLGDVDIGALAFDGKLRGSIKRIGSKTVDLPRFGVLSGVKTKPPISIPLLDFSVPKVLNGQATGIYGKKQKKKGILEAEYEGIKIASDLRKFAKGLKVSNGTLSGEFSIFTMSSSLNKLGAKAYPLLNLLAKRVEGRGYDINYKLLDLSVGSDLKLKYSGKIQLSGQRSSATFENGKSIDLSENSNNFSNSIGLLNTTELKSLLDANGDGKATIKFDQTLNQANFILEYGLYANLVGILEAGKFNVSIGSEIKLPLGKRINAETDLVDIALFKKQKLQLLKDFRIVGGNKTISLPRQNYQFSKSIEFSIPANADELIGILGLNPTEFYTIRGTSSADNLVTRTERGNDTFIGGEGRDTMTGGFGDDTYYLSDLDVVVEDANAGIDTIIYNGPGSFSLENYANVEVLDLRTTERDRAVASGNSLDNTIYASEYQRSVLRGLTGNDVLIGKSQNDQLEGGDGNDILVGGGGRDFFVFDPAHLANSVDTVKDFETTDMIEGFTGYDKVISRNDLVLGTAAITSRPSLIYNQSTGEFFVDFDGTGINQPQLFAILENRPIISGQNLF